MTKCITIIKQGRRLTLRQMMPLILIWLVPLALAACAGLTNPPRLATATAQAVLPPTETPAPLVIAAPTPTPAGSTTAPLDTDLAPNPVLSVWINETAPEQRDALQAMMDGFTAVHNIDIELMTVSPMLLPELVNTAVVSATLPDIIIHPIEYTAGWAARGYFNLALTSDVIAELGPESFDPAALALLNTAAGPAAVPSDGFQNLLIYRTDWVAENGLRTPNNFADMFALAEATFDLEEKLTTGFVIPTESNLVSTHQIFEQIAAANGCRLIDEKGEIFILEPACREAFTFYYDIVHQFSPPGVQTDTSARNAYLEGRTGMIMTAPDFLPQLAGLDPDGLPSCPECSDNPSFLLENSGILTTISGFGNESANFGALTNVGITREADAETAVPFINYWFNNGYAEWLAIEPERKVPMRWGTVDQPRIFIDSWGTTPIDGQTQSLGNLFGAETVTALQANIASSPRWGIVQGQGALMTQIYEELTLSIVLQEMLSGYFNSSQSQFEAYNRFIDLIPNYQYIIDIEATLEPEN